MLLVLLVTSWIFCLSIILFLLFMPKAGLPHQSMISDEMPQSASSDPLNTQRKYFKRNTKIKHPIAALLAVVIIGISVGAVYAQQLAGGQLSGKTAENSSQQTGKLSSAVKTPGPAQDNNLFSQYPAWSQNFATDTSSTVNQKDWEVNEGPAQNSNNEAEYYTDSSTNLRVKDGALTLEATKQAEPQNYNYASARIDTNGKQQFLYGRIDITAKLPNGVGTWPAAWLLPANNTYEDLSPASDSTRYMNGGEIDMIEEVGFKPDVEYGIVHTLSDRANPGGVGSYNVITVPNNNTNYNLYSLLWTPSSITFEVNNIPFYTYSKQVGSNYATWPFDQPFYLILDLAIGGSWGGQDVSQSSPNGVNNAALPSSMDISSIYYYPYVGASTTDN